MQQLTRRDFIKLVTTALLSGSGIIGLAGLIRYLDFDAEPSRKTDFDLGPASAYPMDSQTVLADVPALLTRSKDGFSALSLVCTHLGCTVQRDPEGFSCPCHGSRFDRQGSVTRGPALKPLQELRIEITSDGRLHLHTD